MKLKDIRIGTQLRLGLGVILALVALLGALAWVQSDLLWEDTKDLYEHPLAVRRAVGELKADVLAMSRGMKELCLGENDLERQTTLQGIDTAEADAHQQFNILSERYLGPRSDVDEAYQAFVQWKAIREEVRGLLREGRTAEAASLTKSSSVGGAHVEKLLGHVEDISAFAKAKGDEFYLSATQRNENLKMQLGLVVTVILLLTLGVGYLLLKGIKDPLRALTALTGQYRQGKFDARSRYQSTNEFGALAVAFNQMARTVQTELRLNENAAKLAAVMLREEELHAFCQALLKELLKHTGSQVGAVYLLNERKTDFVLCESVGLGAGGRAAFSATGHEGEFGAALARRQIQRVTDIPADSRFTFATVSGDFRPREIITIPLLADHTVAAVISLASVRSYPEPAVRLVGEIWSLLTARMNGVLAFRQLRDLSAQLEHQNTELGAQKRELAAQTAELTEQNTELEMQKRQLDEASRLKSAFLSNMSHELRTPLNSVIALSGVLNRRLANRIPAEEYSYLEVIERNGKHLLSLINDILDLSRIEAGRADLSLTRFSVRTLIAEILDMLEPQARDKQIDLLSDVGDDLPILTSDYDKCRHILQNLVGNAVKFTETGRVAIRAEVLPATSAIRIAVTDTGIGIAAEQLVHIFEEFRQGDESTSRKYGGTGLGLAIASKYAALLQGDIRVTSTPGQGSTFTLTLPLTIALPDTSATEEHAGRAGSARPASPPPGQGRRILLVEDSEPAVIQMTDMLSQHGYRVQVARHGREALEHIEQALPDAVILDLMMPGVDGFQVLQAIRGGEKSAQLPVLILTAKAVTREELSFLEGNHIQQLIQKGDISRAELLAAVAKMVAPATASAMKGNREGILAQGFDGYVSKPIDAAVLRQAIREVLA
jgi:signal transduction histidine kinase/DNA-binding NarL/FixJ family response regulator/HAMP domain-containing protein